MPYIVPSVGMMCMLVCFGQVFQIHSFKVSQEFLAPVKLRIWVQPITLQVNYIFLPTALECILALPACSNHGDKMQMGLDYWQLVNSNCGFILFSLKTTILPQMGHLNNLDPCPCFPNHTQLYIYSYTEYQSDLLNSYQVQIQAQLSTLDLAMYTQAKITSQLQLYVSKAIQQTIQDNRLQQLITLVQEGARIWRAQRLNMLGLICIWQNQIPMTKLQNLGAMTTLAP